VNVAVVCNDIKFISLSTVLAFNRKSADITQMRTPCYYLFYASRWDQVVDNQHIDTKILSVVSLRPVDDRVSEHAQQGSLHQRFAVLLLRCAAS
jgi:hypothetical protein